MGDITTAHTRGLRVLDQFEFENDAAARLAYSTTPELSAVPYGKNAHITEVDGYTICRFYTSGVFTVPEGVSGNVELLVVGAGGGGGGGYFGGGGGGGGVVHVDSYAVTAGNYTVTVGLGGAGAAIANGFRSGNGGNSQFDSVIAIGGGGGGSCPTVAYTTYGPTTGGSGGGGATTGGAAGTDTQGYAGGAGYSPIAGGGGGGAASAGTDATSSAAGVGGAGVSFTIEGRTVVYGQGGTPKVGSGGYTAGQGGQASGGSGGLIAGYYGGNGAVVIKYRVSDLTISPITIDVSSDVTNRIHGGSSLLIKANKMASVSRAILPVNASHCNYLSVRLKSNKAGSNLKIRFYNGKSLLVGGTASSDSNTTYSYIVFDNDESGLWSSASTPLTHWCKYDLGVGNTATAKYLRIKKSFYYTNASCYLKSFMIQGSNDDTNWTTLLSNVCDDDYYDNQWHCEAIANDIPYRYYRIYTTDTYIPPPSVGAVIRIEEVVLSDTPTYFDIIPEVTEVNVWKNYDFDISSYTKDGIANIEFIVLNDDIDTVYNVDSIVASAKLIQGPEYKWDKLGPGFDASTAIDALGRLFAWGQNQRGFCGVGNCQYDTRPTPEVLTYPELEYITMPTQVGVESNWVKVDNGEYSSIVMNTLGELWGFGEPDGCSPFGLPIDSGEHPYEWTGTYTPAVGTCNCFYAPVRVAPGYTFKDFAHCYYCTLAIGQDDKLYVFGNSEDWALGLGDTDTPVYTATVHPYLTDDIKLVSTKFLCCAAVTTDNKVYGWGASWGYNSFEDTWPFYSDVPAEVQGLPEGAVITQLVVDYGGILVLLSNGEVWGAGDVNLFANEEDINNYPDGSGTFQRLPMFEGMVITKIFLDCMGSFVMTGIDSSGRIYGVTDDELFDGVSDSAVSWLNNFDTLTPCYFFDGPYRFKDYASDTYNDAALAITIDGYLMACGDQSWGPHMAMGLPYFTSYWEDTPFYASYARDAEDWESAGLNLFLTSETTTSQQRPTQWIM